MEKSQALLDYQQDEELLFQKLLNGKIDMFTYQMEAADTLEHHAHGFTAKELDSAQKAILRRHSDFAEALSQQGHPYPGNDPRNPN